MLASLFPRAHARFTSIPVVGMHLDGLSAWLVAQGRSREAIRERMAAARHLLLLLRRRKVVSLGDLTASALRSYAPSGRRHGARSLRALVRSLATYLDERRELTVPPPTPSERRVAEFRRYLDRVRGLAPATIAAHCVVVVEFLDSLDHDTRPARLVELSGMGVETFVRQACDGRSRSRAAQVVGSLRAFLRFLAARGDVAQGLDSHVESPRIWRGENLPRGISWDEVRAFLGSIDRGTPKGRRDHAMFLLVATYGLRRSEVAALRLDDIAWRARQVRVPRPKSGTPLLLPLTDDVGASLSSYLRFDRPPCAHRALFLRVAPPVGPLQPGAVTAAFRSWTRRAGTRLPPRGGPHTLRHALALHLLREGAEVKTIGDLLGHRRVETTSVYLRIDTDGMREVALPLPEGVAPVGVRP